MPSSNVHRLDTSPSFALCNVWRWAIIFLRTALVSGSTDYRRTRRIVLIINVNLFSAWCFLQEVKKMNGAMCIEKNDLTSDPSDSGTSEVTAIPLTSTSPPSKIK